MQTQTFDGSNRPGVTALLREMLQLLRMTPPQRTAFRRKIEASLQNREDISIRAKLLSLTRVIPQEPWAYPALVDTPNCKKLYSEMKQVSDISDKPASLLSDPVSDLGIGAGVAKYLAPVAGVVVFGLALTRYFAGKSKDYHAFHAQRISDELALRGIPPSSLA